MEVPIGGIPIGTRKWNQTACWFGRFVPVSLGDQAPDGEVECHESGMNSNVLGGFAGYYMSRIAIANNEKPKGSLLWPTLPDLSELVTTVHLVNATLQDHGFGPQLLCSAFGLRPDDGAPAASSSTCTSAAPSIRLPHWTANGGTMNSNCVSAASSPPTSLLGRIPVTGFPYGGCPSCNCGAGE